MEIKQVVRKTNKLKPDPNQPRKSFDEEKIKNLAKTYKSQGIINPIEINENDIIITGELRWRAAKVARISDIECKLLLDITEYEKFERQLIENLHHNLLTTEESDNAIQRLWDSKKYNSIEELAKKLGRTNNSIKDTLKMPELEEEIGKENLVKLGKRSAIRIDQAIKNKIDKKKVVKKAIQEKLSQPQVHELVKTIKTLPKDVKEEVLKPQAEITLEEAKDIAESFKKPEHRKEAIKIVKKQKKDQKMTMEYMKDVEKGKIEAPIKVVNIDQSTINSFSEVHKQVVLKMRMKNVKSYNKKTQVMLIKIMKTTFEHLQKELNMESVINV